MASKFSNSFLLLRRSYAAAAENLRGQQPAAASLTRKVTDSTAQVCGVKKEEFWMKDPSTGNWIPESQFNQIDVADLRKQLLPKKNNDS